MTKQFLRVVGVVVIGMTLAAVMLCTAMADPGVSRPTKPAASAHPREKDLASAKLRYYWKRELNLAGTERITRMYAMDENLYLITNTNHLRAIDAAVGNPRWFVRVGNSDNRIFEPTHVPGMRLPERIGTIDDIDGPKTLADFDTFDAVLINSMTDLMVVERKKGKVYRDVRFEGRIATDAGVSDGTLYYVGTGQKNYCAIKLMPNVLMWREHIGQIVAAPMAYYDGRIFMGTMDGLLRCADVNSYGRKRWERKFDGSIPAKFHVDARGLFFACNDHRIHAFNPYTGKKLWPAVVVKGAVGGPMQMGEKTLFQYIKDDGLYAVNVTNGDVRWKMPAGRNVLAIIDDVVYVLDAEKKLHLVNEITGKADAVVSLAGFDFYARNTTMPAIYTATRSGQLFCLRPIKAGRLTAEMLTK